jgi:uncharacterized membrane protein
MLTENVKIKFYNEMNYIILEIQDGNSVIKVDVTNAVLPIVQEITITKVTDELRNCNLKA